MKKGMLDLSLFVVIFGLVILAIVVLSAYYINNEISSGLTDAGLSAEEIAVGTGKSAIAIGTMDLGFAIITFGFGIVSIISAFVIRTHPVFFVLMLILNLILGVIAPSMSNIVNAFAEADGISAVTTEFQALLFITNNLSFIFLGLSLIIGSIMYSKGADSL